VGSARVLPRVAPAHPPVHERPSWRRDARRRDDLPVARGRAHGAILVGTASWTDKSLVQSGWYPEGCTSAEDRLRHYASHFPLVEVDSTYYFPPRPAMARAWVLRTPEHFTFDVKAFSLLTQHPTNPDALPEGAAPAGKKRVYLKDIAAAAVDEVWDRFLSALDPLHRAGKLGALLFQFPPWFSLKGANKSYVAECARRAEPFDICVEFRHPSWTRQENVDESVELLQTNGVAFVAVDMPARVKGAIPPVTPVTSKELAVVRLHGRNRRGFEERSFQGLIEYRYTKAQLQAWVPKLRRLATQVERVHVVFRNAHEDFAVRNAAELQRLLAAG
jgi:uncharacterized protein YecE (DUF72 family)